MVEVANRVGRLVEIRASAAIGVTDAASFEREVRDRIRLETQRVVVAVDLTRMRILSNELADRLLVAMKADNLQMERAGFLISPESASLEMQFERLIREAGSAQRRLFFSPEALSSWLGEVLTLSEKTRLEFFLREPLRPAA